MGRSLIDGGDPMARARAPQALRVLPLGLLIVGQGLPDLSPSARAAEGPSTETPAPPVPDVDAKGPKQDGGAPPPPDGAAKAPKPKKAKKAPMGGKAAKDLPPHAPAVRGPDGVDAPPPGVTPLGPPRSTPDDARVVPGPKPEGAQRAYDSGARTPPPRPTASNDHRYARPDPHHVRPAPGATPPPGPAWYRPYYTRWYVHPYYRWVVATYVVVAFTFEVQPWVVTWAPPPRAGWVWEPGYWSPMGFWVPGHWQPLSPPPSLYPTAAYVYVPGWWQGGIYVEGYWRLAERGGWSWVDGYYLADGTYVAGHWAPSGKAPSGYVWESGFFDGEAWHEGFWRPQLRAGYTWVNAWFDQDGVYHGGYWMPTETKPDSVWIPGWFDGNRWIEGYWVTEAEYTAADPGAWTAPEGWSDGRSAESVAPAPAEGEDVPLAIPVQEGAKD